MDSMRVKNITLTVESRLDPKGTDFSQSCSGNPGEKNNLCIRTKSGWKGIFWCEDSSKKTKYKEACCTALLVSSTSVFSFFRHCCEECHVREGRWESTARMINPLKRKFFFGSGRDSCAIDTAPLPFLWYMHTFFSLIYSYFLFFFIFRCIVQTLRIQVRAYPYLSLRGKCYRGTQSMILQTYARYYKFTILYISSIILPILTNNTKLY